MADQRMNKGPNKPVKYGPYLLSSLVIKSLRSAGKTPDNLKAMTGEELSKIKGVGPGTISEIHRVNTGGTPYPDTEDASVDIEGHISKPSPEMSIVNLGDYSETESYDGKELFVLALKPHHAAWLKLYALEFCARRRIEDLNYGLALEGIVRGEMAGNPMEQQRVAAEDSPVAQRV